MSKNIVWGWYSKLMYYSNFVFMLSASAIQNHEKLMISKIMILYRMVL